MITLQTVFETLRKDAQATYLCTEDATAAGFLLFKFQLVDKLEIVVFYDIRSNEITKFEAIDDFEWENDRAMLDCDSQLDLLVFCTEAIKRQVKSRRQFC